MKQEDKILQCVSKSAFTDDMTLKEISRLTGLEINAVSGRVNGLKKSGKLKEAQKRRCRVTGRFVTPVYAV
jgi:DNA-binding IclR family transcriptional regulator